MPHERTLLYTGHDFEVEHVRSRASAPDQGDGWSDPYAMAAGRIVFPITALVGDLRSTRRLAPLTGAAAGARRLLAGIAHDLGYCSQSHLGAVFRQTIGVTLGEARRALGPSARI